ncbi:MAG: hypothetical protein ACYDCQ_20255 [Dehalococcoidia bacterium]
MTLIYTSVTRSAIVQVSDRRLTLPDGRLHDDGANKAIVVVCADARFCVSYTGLATIGRKRTDEWIIDYLSERNAGRMTTTSVMNCLEDGLGRALLPLRGYGASRSLSLVLAGYRNGAVFVAITSNFDDGYGHLSSTPTDAFKTTVFWRKQGFRSKRAWVSWHGMTTAVDTTLRRRMSKMRRHIYYGGGPVAVPLLVSQIRMAARHPVSGTRIGTSCMSVVISRTGPMEADYHPLHASPHHFMPHLITPLASFKSVEVWGGDGPPPWRSGGSQ